MRGRLHPTRFGGLGLGFGSRVSGLESRVSILGLGSRSLGSRASGLGPHLDLESRAAGRGLPIPALGIAVETPIDLRLSHNDYDYDGDSPNLSTNGKNRP